jgi:hypothetical protein
MQRITMRADRAWVQKQKRLARARHPPEPPLPHEKVRPALDARARKEITVQPVYNGAARAEQAISRIGHHDQAATVARQILKICDHSDDVPGDIEALLRVEFERVARHG